MIHDVPKDFTILDGGKPAHKVFYTMPTQKANSDRATRIKRLHYRSWHRGCKETDLLFGRFADEVLPTLDDAALDQYEAILEEQDADLWPWFCGQAPLPERYLNHPVWDALVEVNRKAVERNAS